VEKKVLTKPDGRQLILYSRGPIAVQPMPGGGVTSPIHPNPHLRWHPLRSEWVVYATYRQDRTFLPPAEHNPLAPSSDPAQPTELPAGDYDVAVFDNLFPAFSREAAAPPDLFVPTAPAHGACEVVVFTQDPRQSLGRLPLAHLELILEVWADRYRELGDREDVRYVMPFENRGTEVGVTLHHPHGQIYAYPFVPPIPERELDSQARYFAEHGSGLLESIIDHEIAERERLVYDTAEAVAFMPVFARYSYEVWVAPRRAAPSFADLSDRERQAFARALKTVLLKFDGLWGVPFPYVMVIHQAPTDGLAHPEAHLHVEFYPAFRMKGRLKYLAGSELGAGVFTADTLPEQKAAELRAVEVQLD